MCPCTRKAFGKSPIESAIGIHSDGCGDRLRVKMVRKMGVESGVEVVVRDRMDREECLGTLDWCEW